ncbi:MAG: PilT/PilU family type 4a pilus ATPase [Gammaproteobacteria bacterium]|nr:PilT/PilU family type 4a pilus ATPase [Gammaproteobacteria bacterium]
MARIDAFLKLGLAQGCSDIHLAVGVPPMLRMSGDLLPIKFRNLTSTELDSYINEILNEVQIKEFNNGNDVDFSYVTEQGTRFRANVFRKTSGSGAVFRFIPTEVPTLEKLNLPPIIQKLTNYHQGMILVTGATGTGKSTTLAAMIDHMNANRAINILTLEDPIEFVHPSKQAQVIHREVGTHVNSFSHGLRAALREDPDVILVGELRDEETITLAMEAAETGHLVLGTMHTTTAVKTIDRVIDALPGEKREQAKMFLATSLKGVISQVLCKTAEGRGRQAALEIMVPNRAISKLIMEDKIHMIKSQLQTGKEDGMQLLDQHLMQLVENKMIDPDDAYIYAQEKGPFERYASPDVITPE